MINNNGLQNLISLSKGFVDIFKISNQAEPILIPQNIVLSIQRYTRAETHDLPIYDVSVSSVEEPIGLTIEGNSEKERFILLCNDMPENMRLRISEVSDETHRDQLYATHCVKVQNEVCQIPNLDKIYAEIASL